MTMRMAASHDRMATPLLHSWPPAARAGDTIVVTESGVERVTESPRDLEVP